MAIFVVLAILKYLLYAVLAIILLMELYQITQMIRRYKQGLDVMYFPLVGLVFYQLCRKKEKDTARWIKERVRKNDLKGKKAIAMNLPFVGQPLVLIQDPDMINDILTREMDICLRKDMNKGVNLFDLGNFYDYSERAMGIRGAFTEVFRAENMDSMAPKIQKVVDEVIDSIEQEQSNQEQLKSKGYMDVNLRLRINEMFLKILDKVLFGAGADTLIEGKPLSNQIVQVLSDITNLFKKPLTYITLGLSVYTRLDPEVKEIDRMMRLIKQKIMELYNLKKDDPDVKANDFLGGVIHYNRDHPEEPLNEREITGNVILMVFAAYDTSRHSTGWAMRFLSVYQNEQKDLRAEAEKLGTLGGELDGQKLEAGPELNAWMKESLRIGAPFAFSEIREFTKRTKVKGVEFQKGDIISFVLVYNQFKEKDFPDAYRFDRTRHYKGKAKYHRNNLMPFGGGKRGCIGKYLAIMNIKIIVLSFMRRYSVETDPSFDSQNWHFPFHTLDKVMVRLRKL